jgi:hypothetical protein
MPAEDSRRFRPSPRGSGVVELHSPADDLGWGDSDDRSGGLSVRVGRVGQRVGRAADAHAAGSPRRQHVVDDQCHVVVGADVAVLATVGEVVATDVDGVQSGVVPLTQWHHVRHPGRVYGGQPSELAPGQIGELSL